jgi:hypothetical protein
MDTSYPLLSSTFHRRFVPRTGAVALWSYLGFASASCSAAALGLGAGSPSGSAVAFGWALAAGALAIFAWRRAWRRIGDELPG